MGHENASMPSFSIVVPTFERLDVLPSTLDALVATEYPRDNFEIIVVDDAADPKTKSVVDGARADQSSRVMLLSSPRRGAAAARNLGAQAASGDYVVFVDDDIVVPPHHLAAQLETRAVHGECISGADWWAFTPEVAADLLSSPLGRFRLAVEEGYRKRSEQRWTFPTGLATAHLTVPRDLFFDLNGFDERFPRAGVEDWDFCIRARDRGCTLILDNELVLLHNDKRLTLDQLCVREGWRAVSVGILSRIHWLMYRDSDVVRENAPIQANDPWLVRTRKVIKQVLATRVGMAMVHRGMRVCERVLRPECLLHRLYTAVISVHYLRGFRAGFASPIVIAEEQLES